MASRAVAGAGGPAAPRPLLRGRALLLLRRLPPRPHPELLEQVRRIVGVPIRVLCVTRNPFDTVATLARRHEESIEWAAERYAGWAEPLARIRSALEPDELLDVRHEDLVADPARELDRLCTFLDIDAPDEYLAACASIVFPSARRPRDGRDWPDPVTHQIEDLI